MVHITPYRKINGFASQNQFQFSCHAGVLLNCLLTDKRSISTAATLKSNILSGLSLYVCMSYFSFSRNCDKFLSKIKRTFFFIFDRYG